MKSNNVISNNQWNEAFQEYKSIENEEYFIKFLDKVSFPQCFDKKILDVGCADGGGIEVLLKRGYTDVSGLEISEDLYKTSPVAEKIINGSILDVSNISQRYDVVLIKGVLHHLGNFDEYRLAITNISKLLVEGGKVYSFEPWATWFRPMATIALHSPLSLLSKRVMAIKKYYLLEEDEMIRWLKVCKEVYQFFRSTFNTQYESTDMLYKYYCGEKK